MPEIHARVIPEHPSDKNGGRLGRHVLHDPRSRGYEAEKATAITDVKHAYRGLPLDQGNVGSCTGEAAVGALNTDPNFLVAKLEHPYIQTDAYNVYHDETVLEGEPWPPNDPGGTGLMVCRAAKHRGWIKSYRHAFGLDHALKALVKRPVMFGVNWYEGFDQPDVTGTVHIAGQVRGGHEVMAFQIVTASQVIGCVNSWGRWGLNGSGVFYVPFADMDRLLGEDGDCTVPYP